MSDFADNLANGVLCHGWSRLSRFGSEAALSCVHEDLRALAANLVLASERKPGLLHLLDGLLIVSAVDIFGAPKMIGATDDVSAIQGHSTLMCQPPEGWRRALSVC